jgi:hypothetical protein
MTLSYSLFGDPNSFEFPFYLRGLYFNLRMNRILYPEFNSMVMLQRGVLQEPMIEDLQALFPELTVVRMGTAPRCESMLWRMSPLFEGTDVICRDTDSVSTYREACCVYKWLDSGFPFHAINDNNAHAGLMGGMVAFKSKEFPSATGFKSFPDMVKGLNLNNHGSDQNFMNKSILPKIVKKLLVHKDRGAGCTGAETKDIPTYHPKLNTNLWVADLISRYIGSAGVIDFELLRFLKSVQKDVVYDNFEKRFPKTFYWV